MENTQIQDLNRAPQVETEQSRGGSYRLRDESLIFHLRRGRSVDQAHWIGSDASDAFQGTTELALELQREPTPPAVCREIFTRCVGVPATR
jgi:hypothetical protein